MTRRNNGSFDAALRLIAKSRWRSETDILRHPAARAVTRWIPVSVLVRFRPSRLGGPRSQNLAGSNLSHRHPGSLDRTGRSSLFLAPLHWRTLHGAPRSQPPNANRAKVTKAGPRTCGRVDVALDVFPNARVPPAAGGGPNSPGPSDIWRRLTTGDAIPALFRHPFPAPCQLTQWAF